MDCHPWPSSRPGPCRRDPSEGSSVLRARGLASGCADARSPQRLLPSRLLPPRSAVSSSPVNQRVADGDVGQAGEGDDLAGADLRRPSRPSPATIFFTSPRLKLPRLREASPVLIQAPCGPHRWPVAQSSDLTTSRPWSRHALPSQSLGQTRRPKKLPLDAGDATG